MEIKTFKLHVQTQGFTDIHDLTKQAQLFIDQAPIKNGQVTFFVAGSTAGLTTVEFESGLVLDLKAFYERIIPEAMTYHHEQAWHDGNGFSHVRASLLKPSLTVPLMDGRLMLGTWQQVVLIDFDNRPRQREIVLQLIGN